MTATPLVDDLVPRAALANTPPLPRVLGALGGFAALGLCAGLGSVDPEVAARAVPASLAIAAAPFALTTPALLVVHQLLGLSAGPDQLVGAVADTLVRAGRLALGLAPSALFFAATSDLALPFFIASAMAIGGFTVLCSASSLVAAERSAARSPAEVLAMRALALGWMALTTLIGLRIAFSATVWAFLFHNLESF